MPLTQDLALVRSILDRDRRWAAYAIGDLAPQFVTHCEWRVPAHDTSALVLVYRGFEPAILFAMGDAGKLPELFAEIAGLEVSLHVREDARQLLSAHHTLVETRLMVRMALDVPVFQPAPIDAVQPVGEDDLAAINALYADGFERGEGPAFFAPAMLRQGTFRGVWEGRSLVAIAGTHLYSPALGVCTIGNVYTRSDHRGQGLAAQVTSAVASQAIVDRIPTIVLNVGEHNVTARRVYQRLGFATYCTFFEGTATL